jgi:hypothetical protein
MKGVSFRVSMCAWKFKKVFLFSRNGTGASRKLHSCLPTAVEKTTLISLCVVLQTPIHNFVTYSFRWLSGIIGKLLYFYPNIQNSACSQRT